MTPRHFTLAFIVGGTDASLTVIEQPEDPTALPKARQYRTEYPSRKGPADYPSDEMLYLWQQFHADLITANVMEAIDRTEAVEEQKASPHRREDCQGPDTCPYCSPIDQTTDHPCPNPGKCTCSEGPDIPPPTL